MADTSQAQIQPRQGRIYKLSKFSVSIFVTLSMIYSIIMLTIKIITLLSGQRYNSGNNISTNNTSSNVLELVHLLHNEIGPILEAIGNHSASLEL